MKEVHETVVLNVPQVNQNPFNINVNPLLSQPFVGLHPADSIVTSGEAPMDVEKDDEVVTNQPGNFFALSSVPLPLKTDLYHVNF